MRALLAAKDILIFIKANFDFLVNVRPADKILYAIILLLLIADIFSSNIYSFIAYIIGVLGVIVLLGERQKSQNRFEIDKLMLELRKLDSTGAALRAELAARIASQAHTKGKPGAGLESDPVNSHLPKDSEGGSTGAGG